MGRPVRPGRSGTQAVWGGGGLLAAFLGGGVGSGSVGGFPGGGGRRVAVPQSIPMPPLYGHKGGLCWCRSVHGGCGLHAAPARVHALLTGRGPRGALWGVLVLLPGGWRAGWQAGKRRGLSMSLWEQAGDAPGASGAWTQRHVQCGALPRAPRSSRGGGVLPWPGLGGTGPTSPGPSPAHRGLWGGSERVASA